MDNVGFIREKLDIKLLVLFVLSRLTRPVTILALSDLVLTESSVNYFDFIDALSSLVKSEHVMELDEDRYIITSKGTRNLAEFETRIPYNQDVINSENLSAPVTFRKPACKASKAYVKLCDEVVARIEQQ